MTIIAECDNCPAMNVEVCEDCGNCDECCECSDDEEED